MIGRTISHYRILEKLGEGGMGVVYIAQDTRLDRKVALKFLSPELTSDPGAKARFIHEARAASALDHHNICTIYEVDETPEGQSFISMVLYSGDTLKKKIEEGRLTLETAVLFASQIAEGLARAHESGIVHRDIKPANIMITDRNEVKIVDFGLAKLAGGTTLTKEGRTIGTAAYMSPEQALGGSIDRRTDIWSLGIMFYEMLTGKRPFTGIHDAALLYEIVHEQPKPLRELRAEIPDALERIVCRAMEKDVTARYQSLDEMLFDLHAYRDGTTHRSSSSRSRRSPPTRPKKKHLLFMAGAAVLLATLLYVWIPMFRATGSPEVPSLAVLYLKNLGAETDEPFSYGITQDLIVDVAKAGLVRVAPMKDILSVQKSDFSIGKIAQMLHVRYVMDGSLQRDGNVFRLSAQIVEASSGKTLWADRIQANIADAGDLQGRLAEGIITALQLKPSQPVARDITRRKSTDPEAYEFYLRASYRYSTKRTKDDFAVARGLFEKSIGLDSGFIRARVGLGIIDEASGEYDSAQHTYAAAFAMARSQGDPVEEAHCLARSGVVQWHLGNLPASISFDSQALSAYRDLGDRRGEAITLNNLGAVYQDQGENAKAIDAYSRCWKTIQELGDRWEESRVLNNLGSMLEGEGEFTKALGMLMRCLELKKELSDRRGEAIVLENIGNAYNDEGVFSKAVEYGRQSLEICRELGIHPVEAAVLSDLGGAYRDHGDLDTALACYDAGLKVLRGIGEKLLEGEIVMKVGGLLFARREYGSAIDSLKRSVAIFEEVGGKEDLMIAASRLALADLKSGLRAEAEKNLAKASELFLKNPAGSLHIEAAWNLSRGYLELGDSSKGSKYLERAYGEMMTRADLDPQNEFRDSYLNAVEDHREIALAWKSRK